MKLPKHPTKKFQQIAKFKVMHEILEETEQVELEKNERHCCEWELFHRHHCQLLVQAKVSNILLDLCVTKDTERVSFLQLEDVLALNDREGLVIISIFNTGYFNLITNCSSWVEKFMKLTVPCWDEMIPKES